jgi:hypothetical protein
VQPVHRPQHLDLRQQRPQKHLVSAPTLQLHVWHPVRELPMLRHQSQRGSLHGTCGPGSAYSE